jgi:hypothetical protein
MEEIFSKNSKMAAENEKTFLSRCFGFLGKLFFPQNLSLTNTNLMQKTV